MKILSFFKKAIFVLTCLFVFVIVGSFLCVYSYSRFDQDGQKACLSKYAAVNKNVYTDITPNDEAIERLSTFISSLSPNVSKVFLKDWKIIISPNPPKELNLHTEDLTIPSNSDDIELEEPSVLGYSNWHLRLIYIKAQPDIETTLKVFAHELGHCFDYEFGSPSSTDEFLSIYNKYKDSFVGSDPEANPGYENSSSEEFFATVFMEYFLFSDHLKDEAPKAYAFLDQLYTEASQNAEASTTVKYDLQSALLILKKKFSK